MKLLILLLLPLQLLSQSKILFKNVDIIDVEKGKVISNQHVLIEGNKIKSISSKALSVKGATVIYATGKYLMPGLCDFNASVLEYESSGSPAFALMLAYGVTSVRDLLPSKSLVEAFEIKKDIASGKILAPRLYLSGKTLIHRLPFQKENENKSLLVTSAREAQNAVDSMIKLGADVLDTRNVLNEPILKAITKRAHQKGKKVMARFSGNWITASNNGIDAFTHISDMWRVVSKGREKLFAFSAADSIRYVSVPEFYNRVLGSLGSVDTPYFYSLINTFKKNDTWICSGVASYDASKKRFEHGDTIRNQFRTSKQKILMVEHLKTLAQLTYAPSNAQKPILSYPILAIKAGVPLLAGTQMEDFITPGMSLHDVLYWFVDGGLSPAQVLRTATINPAVFLNKQKELGTVETGKLADLVLLDANPLTDINNTRKINAVVANGKLLQRKDLDKLLEEAKEKVRQQ